MSYILDALKKSEAERSNGDHPEFAHRVPFEPTPRKQREIWPYLLVLALVANALVIGYVVWPESNPENAVVVSGEPAPVQRQQQPPERRTDRTTPESPGQEQAETLEASSASGTSERSEASAPIIADDTTSEEFGKAQSDSSVQEKPAQEQAAQAQKVADPEPPAKAETAETTTEVPDINAMPRSVQQRVPEMTFNAHLYSSKPSSRQVMINNRKLREGDRVGELVIEEITAAGVVFRLDDRVFQIGIVRDWQGAN